MKNALLCLFIPLAACAHQNQSQSTTAGAENPAEYAQVEAPADASHTKSAAPAEDEAAHAHGAMHHGQAHGEGHPIGRRFTDPEEMAKHWEGEARDAWQDPGYLMTRLGIETGMTVADIGAGTGYFIPHLVGAVGPTGLVYAVDIEAAMLEYIDARAQSEGWQNVKTATGTPTGTPFEANTIDIAIIVNTWHHIPQREAYSRHLAHILKPGGTVFIIDFNQDSEKGPGKHHKLDPQSVWMELNAGDLKAEILDEALSEQYIVMGQNIPSK